MGLFLLLLLGTLLANNVDGYLNDLDGLLTFKCPYPYQYVSHVDSIHDNHKEDRRFNMACKDIVPNGDSQHLKTHCIETGNENQLDGLLAYTCPGNSFINGMSSSHDNRHEDRAWRFHCCSIAEVTMTNCELGDWTNDWDGYQTFDAGEKVTKGVTSIHDNRKEDRLYKFETCTALIDGTLTSAVGK